jgi:hypothetical protein
MPSFKTAQVEVFRLDIENLMKEYAERMRISIVKNKAVGMSFGGIRTMRESDKTKWAAQRAILNRAIKSKVAGLINLIHIQGYSRELR